MLSRFNCINNYSDPLKCVELGEKVKQFIDTEELVSKFNSTVTATCDAVFKVLRAGDHLIKGRRVPWWTSELTILRK